MSAIAATPTSGTHLSTVFDVNVTGAAANTATGYSTSIYPTEPAIVYYAEFTSSGHTTLKSPLFSTNAVGAAEWHGVLIPDAATWTLSLKDNSDDSTIASSSVTVA